MVKFVGLVCLSVMLCVGVEAAPGGVDQASTQICPDNKATCEAESTCCGTACCPLKNAVCCADGSHCCPGGTTCNMERSTCDTVPVNNMTARPAVRKQQTTTPAPDPRELSHGVGVTCPDRVSQCSVPGAACCRMSGSSKFGCCNYPLNVCCDDGYHCCHVGTVCDQTTLRCIPYPTAVQSLPWIDLTASSSLDAAAATAVEAVVRSEQKAEYIVCPDGGLCPDLNTCCMLTSGRYGCCPYYLATCCQDRIHCCPYGKHCTDTGLCVGNGEDKLPWAALFRRNP